MVISIEKPASRRQPSTASCSRRFAGPGVVRHSIRPTAQRWRLRAARVEIARRRMAVFQSTSVDGSSISPKTMSIIPSSELVLVRRRSGRATSRRLQLGREPAHRQRLDPIAHRERDRGAEHPLPAQRVPSFVVSIRSAHLAKEFGLPHYRDRTPYEYSRRTPYEPPIARRRHDTPSLVSFSATSGSSSAFWLVVTVAAFAAIGPAGSSLSQQFNVPGREGYETNKDSPRSTATAATSLRSSRSCSFRRADRRLARRRRASSTRRSRRSQQALPDARTASYASTGDRAFVSDDGRTTFALVYIPARGGVDPGQAEARQAQAALAGVTVAGSAGRGHRARRAPRDRRRQRAERHRRAASRRCSARWARSSSSSSSSARSWRSCRC